MSTDFDRIFTDFEKNADPSQAGGGGNKIKQQGKHLVEVQACKLKESDQVNAIYFIVEFELQKTNVDDLTVGNSYSWTCDITRRFGDVYAGMNDVAAFLSAAIGKDPSSAEGIGGGHLKEATSDEQPLRGLTVLLETNPKETKAGRTWVQHIWSPVPKGEA